MLVAPTDTTTETDTSPEPAGLSAELREAVTVGGVMEHQRRFASIAEENGGNRAAGTPGYKASAEYVAETLREAGYEVSMQRFDLPASEAAIVAELSRVTSDSEDYDRGEDFSPLQFSGTGEVTAAVQPVDFTGAQNGGAASTSGCELEDFEDFEEGSVALIRRGTCTFGVKVANAEAAGASAALISNSGADGEVGAFQGSLEGSGAEVPVIATSAEVGEELSRSDDAEVQEIRVTVEPGAETTTNVIATSPGGDVDNTVMVGAHLDSTPNSPGMNDNASGSSTVLEIAQEMAGLEEKPRNRMRFAFWGAEEIGLVGSSHYVDQLQSEQLENTAVYLNFDMVASPNYLRFLYGSPQVTEVFENYFDERDLETYSFDLAGRSDHGPFAAEDVPVGGIFSGDSSEKTERQARESGGEAGEPYDRCYHTPCDDLDNLNRQAIREISNAAAHATATFAQRKY